MVLPGRSGTRNPCTGESKAGGEPGTWGYLPPATEWDSCLRTTDQNSSLSQGQGKDEAPGFFRIFTWVIQELSRCSKKEMSFLMREKRGCLKVTVVQNGRHGRSSEGKAMVPETHFEKRTPYLGFRWCCLVQKFLSKMLWLFFSQYNKSFVNNKTPKEHEDQHIYIYTTRPPSNHQLRDSKSPTRPDEYN